MLLSTSKPTAFERHEFVAAPKLNRSALSEIENQRPNKGFLNNVYEELRYFVRRRDSVGLPKGVKLFTFVSVNSGVGFRTGIFSWGRISTKKVVYGAVVGLYPIHWLLVVGGEINENLLDVTDWANLTYKEKRTMDVHMPCHWLVGKYPLDFRSPIELNAEHFLNSMEVEGFIPTVGITENEEFKEAIYFARLLGRVTKEGFLISCFPSGVYFETGRINGWLPNVTSKEAVEVIRREFKNETRS